MKENLTALPWKIHPYSIIVTIILDLFWAFAEIGAVASVVGFFGYPILVILIFITCAFAVAKIQQSKDHDEPGTAWIKGIILGIIAAIPLSFTTMILGAIYKLIQLWVGGDKIWLTGLLADNWSKLEELIRNKVKTIDPKMANGETMESLINFLGKSKVISPTDVGDLHRFRMDRNLVTHNQKAKYLWQTARDSETILRQFKRKLG
jgi:hypothetical protein